MILHAGAMVKFVMLILLSFSLVSWAIIFMKWRFFRRVRQETEYFFDLFWEETALEKIKKECEDLAFSPVAHLFRSGYSELRKTGKIQLPHTSDDWGNAMKALLFNVERALRKTAIEQSTRLEKALSFLATTGNTAPFIGLFGTVWGIMESFRGIGLKGSASLAVVAPGISEALVATAAGLATAIPAVVAFNHFNQKAMIAKSEMDTFSSEFLNLVERQVLKKKTAPRKAQTA
ncbi:MAG: protein TolQ [Deltaproteobacteria bacterium]|nr:protein TolQ [Deltaproteobacteria bacterium]MBW2017163.1 protein TolQ [Deltaproteobacteria bacterium]MBW2129889.1 protein TolQ [Deltaproteobacteria bacterium]MBW2304973.1 protein TolQ [Deltaproteobacteria bacterium]